MRRADVPVAGRPVVSWAHLAGACLVYVGALSFDAVWRPGVVEAVTGVAFGSLAGLVTSRWWVAFLPDLAEVCKRHRFADWAAVLGFPVWRYRAYEKFWRFSSYAWFGSLACCGVVLYAAHAWLPHLGLPWLAPVGAAGRAQVNSLAATMLNDMISLVVAWRLATLRWYYRLPSGGESQ